MKNLKHIPLKNAFNVRDLGGYPTRDGHCTKWGLLYRSDSLSNLTVDDWNVLVSRNIKTVIDLRSIPESTSAKIHIPENMEYYRFSLMQDLDNMPSIEKPELKQSDQSKGIDKFMESMKLDYSKTLFENIECCVDILNTITDRLIEGSVLFMCSAGKDRTGIIAAVVLYLCDVFHEDIIADYMVSKTYNTNGINKKLDSLPTTILKLIKKRDLLESFFESKPETIGKLLEDMINEDIFEFISKHGFSKERQNQLKFLFTENI